MPQRSKATLFAPAALALAMTFALPGPRPGSAPLPPPASFAILARDHLTGEYGVAAASNAPLIGMNLEFLDPDAGGVVVLGGPFPELNDKVLIALRDGLSPGRAIAVGLAADLDKESRQVLAIAPEGVAAFTGDAVVIFDRDESSGALTFKQSLLDGTGTMDGLDGAYSVAVTSDGANFYVAGFNDDAVSVFLWYGGVLSYVGKVKDGVEGVDGLDGANSVTLSSDDSFVYVASRNDDAVSVFWRNPSSGALTYRGMVQDGVEGVDGLNGARAIAIDSGDRYVYVASQWDDALAVFSRDASTGALTLKQVARDTDPGIEGLDVSNGLALSPDGMHIYVSGYGDNAVAVFSRQFFVYLPVVVRNF